MRNLHDKGKTSAGEAFRPDPDEAPVSAQAAVAVRTILTAVGEVVYEWSLDDDRLRWGDNVLDVLRVASLGAISTGRGFAAFLDPADSGSRHDAVLNSSSRDDGDGVFALGKVQHAHGIQIKLMPQGGTYRRYTP